MQIQIIGLISLELLSFCWLLLDFCVQFQQEVIYLTLNMTTLNDDSKKSRKSVDFHSALKVVLIPSRCEYKEAGLYDKLWWNTSEFRYFQQQSFSEIMLMAKGENLDVRSARRKLYQPNLDEAYFNFILDSCEIENGNKSPTFSMQTSLVAQSPRKLVKAPTFSVDQDSDEESECVRTRSPIVKKSPIFSVSSLQDMSSIAEQESIFDELDPFLALESEALSLCVPLDQHFEVEFDRSPSKSILPKRISFYSPSMSTISVVICGIFMLIMTILLRW